MFKILKLSSTGFKLEGEDGVHWFTVDSIKILKSTTFKPPFESLREGMFVDNLKFKEGKDGKKYVVNFDVISQSCLGSGKLRPSGVRVETDSVSGMKQSRQDIHVPSSVSSGRQVLERDEVKPPITDLSSKQLVASSVQDKIIYGQCVNIAFNYVLKYFECKTDDEFWDKVFDEADKVYIKYSKRCLK